LVVGHFEVGKDDVNVKGAEDGLCICWVWCRVPSCLKGLGGTTCRLELRLRDSGCALSTTCHISRYLNRFGHSKFSLGVGFRTQTSNVVLCSPSTLAMNQYFNTNRKGGTNTIDLHNHCLLALLQQRFSSPRPMHASSSHAFPSLNLYDTFATRLGFIRSSFQCDSTRMLVAACLLQICVHHNGVM